MALKKQFHLFGTRIVTALGNCFLCWSSFLPLGCNSAAPETSRNFARRLRGRKNLWFMPLFAGENYPENTLTLLSDTCGSKRRCHDLTKGLAQHRGHVGGRWRYESTGAGEAKVLLGRSRDWPPPPGLLPSGLGFSKQPLESGDHL